MRFGVEYRMSESAVEAASFSISIAGIRVRLRLPARSPLVELRESYRGFSSKSQPDLFLSLVSPYECKTLSPDAKGSAIIGVEDHSLWLGTNGEPISWYEIEGVVSDTLVFGGLVRALFSLLLQDKGGILLHSAGIVHGNQGYVFVGPSGAGKSTVSRFCQGVATRLNDELIALRPVDGRYRIFNTPFWGRDGQGGSDLSAPLKKIFFLVKDHRTFSIPLTTVLCTARLMPSVWTRNRRHKAVGDRVLEVCSSLSAAVPSYELHFNWIRSFWEVLSGLLE